MALVRKSTRTREKGGAQEEPCDCLTEEGLGLIATCPSQGVSSSSPQTCCPLVDLSQIATRLSASLTSTQFFYVSPTSNPSSQQPPPASTSQDGGPVAFCYSDYSVRLWLQMTIVPRLLSPTVPRLSTLETASLKVQIELPVSSRPFANIFNIGLGFRWADCQHSGAPLIASH